MAKTHRRRSASRSRSMRHGKGISKSVLRSLRSAVKKTKVASMKAMISASNAMSCLKKVSA